MRSALKLGLLFLCLLTALGVRVARAETDDDSSATVLVSPEQGEALAAFALQSERRIRPKPDCSHLVHLLYARAGLIYPYEDSRVLYRGVSDFKRVKNPQAGDLAVWLGHVGIVLSPEDKTFLSSVHSGIITEQWTAPHWVRRGRPRFYRYRIGPDADMNLLAKIMNDGTLPHEGVPLPSSATQATSSQTDGLQEERTEPSVQDGRDNSESGRDSASIVAIIDQRPLPSRREIAAAIMENSKARAHQLIAGETLDMARPFSVFSRLEIKKINVKHERGSVTLNVTEPMSQEEGRILPPRTTEHELAIVRRSDGAWVISDPQQRTYLPEKDALETFERQADINLRQAPNSSSARLAVKALDRLYDQQGAPQRAAIR
jgi:NlpC/P60 family